MDCAILCFARLLFYVLLTPFGNANTTFSLCVCVLAFRFCCVDVFLLFLGRGFALLASGGF